MHSDERRVDNVLQNFRRHAVIDVAPLMTEIDANEARWQRNTKRQQRIAVQRETESIFLRSAHKSRYPEGKSSDDMLLCRTTSQAEHYPQCMHFLSQFSAHMRASLQRAMLVRLTGNGRVYPHVDEGLYYAVRDRFHLVLSSPQGSSLTSGDETVIMRTGEVWWFDNKKVHSSSNQSMDWRVHLIFDLLS